MSSWLCIASDYNSIQIALCNANSIIETHSIDKKLGNQRLLADIDLLLKRHNVQLQQVSFIGVNLGPAPYTSLRIAIATANGLHAATGIPVVGIDALKAFVQAHPPRDQRHVTVALLNAFNNELFYAVARCNRPIQTGYEKADMLLGRLSTDLEGLNITMIGNGAAGSKTDYPNMQNLILYAWNQWQKKEATPLALPLYLKQIKP